jgi:acetolactate synthase-1/2/3 large subunit
MKKLLSHQIVDYLERRDAGYVFGLCGHTVIAMLEALEKSESVKYISFRHEQLAATAADGYARIKHKASVMLCHLGPGLTNAATGVANASMDSIPMVIIAGDVPSYYYGRHPHQEINLHCDGSQYDIFKPFVKRAWRIDNPEIMPLVLDRAFSLAESGRPGPVLISVPMDMFSREVDTDLFSRTYNDNQILSKPGLDPDMAKVIAHELISANEPLIHAGGGILLADASEELAALAEFLDIPISRTLMGHGCVSDRHPLMLGQTGFWGFDYTHQKTNNADVILALGTRLAEADSSSWYEGVTFTPSKTKFIQINIDPSELGRNYPADFGAVADLKLALAQILKAAKEIKPEGIQRLGLRAEIANAKSAFKSSNEAICNDGRYPMTPQRILKDVREILPDDALIFTDVGWNKNGVAQQFDITVPGTIHHPSGLATMGFGPAALLGAKLAAPDRKVITLVGDGGFGTNPSVIATAVEQNIPVVWVVMNNSAFGTIAGLENASFGTKFGTEFRTPDGKPYSPDWAEIAKGYGIKALRIEKADDFAPAFKAALDSNEPFLLDVPMENIPVPTPGRWNINDIYRDNDYVKEGRLVKKENGVLVPPPSGVTHR